MKAETFPVLLLAKTDTSTNDTWLATTAPIVQLESRPILAKAGWRGRHTGRRGILARTRAGNCASNCTTYPAVVPIPTTAIAVESAL